MSEQNKMNDQEVALVKHYVGLLMSAYLAGHPDRKVVADEQIDSFIAQAVKAVEKLREWERSGLPKQRS